MDFPWIKNKLYHNVNQVKTVPIEKLHIQEFIILYLYLPVESHCFKLLDTRRHKGDTKELQLILAANLTEQSTQLQIS